MIVTCPDCGQDRNVKRSHPPNRCPKCAIAVRYPAMDHPETMSVECPQCHVARELKWVSASRQADVRSRVCQKCSRVAAAPHPTQTREERLAEQQAVIEEVEWLLSFRMHPQQVARRIGRSVDSIERLLRRHGHPARARFLPSWDARQQVAS